VVEDPWRAVGQAGEVDLDRRERDRIAVPDLTASS